MKTFIKNKKNLLEVFVLILLLFILLNVFQKEVKTFFYHFSLPFQKSLWKIGERSANFIKGIVYAGKLKKELNECNLKNEELISKIVYLEDLEKENHILREALKLDIQKEFKLVLADVIGKDISQDSILINKGEKDGILKNMAVITEQKILVGKISEVYDNFSRVMLISHKDSVVDAGFGIVRGRGNFRLLFDLIPQKQEVKNEEVITTSGLGNDFPKGLLIGKIKEIKKNDLDAFQQAEVQPIFNISQLEKLFIILDF